MLRPELDGSVRGGRPGRARAAAGEPRKGIRGAPRPGPRTGRAGVKPAALRGTNRATGHLQVASAIAAGLADAGVASEPAALAYGLGFVPLAEEHFDLVIPAGQPARAR